MKTLEAHTFPPSSGAPSLEERLAAALAENERLVRLVDELRQENATLKQKILALQERLNRNSTNSNQPPSQDSPFEPPKKEAASRQAPKASPPSPAKKSRPYHKGAKPPLLPPDEIIPCFPGPCSCGCSECVALRVFWIHQWLELPKSLFEVVHFLLHEGRCARCGKRLKGQVPVGHESGFGPGLTALVATLNAGMGVSWRKLGDCLQQVFGIPISQGAINKSLKRASLSIEAHYEAIGRAVRASPVNHADETTWRQHGPLGKKLLWLWVLVNRDAALFRLAESRKAEEFEALRDDFSKGMGTLVPMPAGKVGGGRLFRTILGRTGVGSTAGKRAWPTCFERRGVFQKVVMSGRPPADAGVLASWVVFCGCRRRARRQANCAPFTSAVMLRCTVM